MSVSFHEMFHETLGKNRTSLVAQMVKNLPSVQETQARSLSQRREWQVILAGYSLWDHKESDMTE